MSKNESKTVTRQINFMCIKTRISSHLAAN